MISGIVYTSNSGYTAQYARLLGAALDLPVTDAKWGADPHPGRAVSYIKNIDPHAMVSQTFCHGVFGEGFDKMK